MKLSEITKKGFLDTLKDPEIARIRALVKEFRQHLNQLGWKVTSRYDKHQRTFTINARAREPHLMDLVSGRRMADRTQVYAAIKEFFPPSRYRISINQRSADDILFWVTMGPQT